MCEQVLVNRRIHGGHMQRIRESLSVELYDYKMKDDCRVKGKTYQAMHYLEHAHRVRGHITIDRDERR
jgi:hypothetical protein